MAKIRLSDALRRLNSEFNGCISYQRLFLAVAAGRVPAERDHTGSRWLIDDANLPAIARVFGLTAPTTAPNADGGQKAA
jgi:hypothetical protein